MKLINKKGTQLKKYHICSLKLNNLLQKKELVTLSLLIFTKSQRERLIRNDVCNFREF